MTFFVSKMIVFIKWAFSRSPKTILDAEMLKFSIPNALIQFSTPSQTSRDISHCKNICSTESTCVLQKQHRLDFLMPILYNFSFVKNLWWSVRNWMYFKNLVIKVPYCHLTLRMGLPSINSHLNYSWQIIRSLFSERKLFSCVCTKWPHV